MAVDIRDSGQRCSQSMCVCDSEYTYMRKRIDPSIATPSGLPLQDWLNLECLAEVEITSEDPAHPIETALLHGKGSGWRASEPGRQTLRILFNEPQALRHIHLVFTEEHRSRTQEFVLRWSRGDHQPLEQIVRQQYNFNPPSREVENYVVNLDAVKRLEMEINPAIGGGDSYASLAELRLG